MRDPYIYIYLFIYLFIGLFVYIYIYIPFKGVYRVLYSPHSLLTNNKESQLPDIRGFCWPLRSLT